MNITVYSGPRLVLETQLKTMLLCVLSVDPRKEFKNLTVQKRINFDQWLFLYVKMRKKQLSNFCQVTWEGGNLLALLSCAFILTAIMD